MPPKNPWQYDVNQLNNKGLDLIHPIEQVAKDFYSRMENVKSLQEGTMTPRPGTSLINTVAFDLTGFLAGTASETGNGCGAAAVTIASGSGDGTYGSYSTLIASTSRISKYWAVTLIFNIGLPDLELTSSWDISFDAGSGPEVNFVQAHSVSVGKKSTSPYSTGDLVQFPFEVPAGSRIRIRVFDNDASARNYSFTVSMIG